ncbi:hypothetical protein [Ferrimonas balearica]|uniref:hypothetical protein n=1 Tax=Ferrimonas balearica TaxID=44012 RepID=UPI001C9A1F68|nr:hypothetical protein [Ferrimonas balearica]MBY5993224.1 hypothetical protein [Ferrimonas balearica]
MVTISQLALVWLVLASPPANWNAGYKAQRPIGAPPLEQRWQQQRQWQENQRWQQQTWQHQYQQRHDPARWQGLDDATAAPEPRLRLEGDARPRTELDALVTAPAPVNPARGNPPAGAVERTSPQGPYWQNELGCYRRNWMTTDYVPIPCP